MKYCVRCKIVYTDDAQVCQVCGFASFEPIQTSSEVTSQTTTQQQTQ